MATTQIRCPKCGFVCLLEDEKTQQYNCHSCNTVFRIVEKAGNSEYLNCPECGILVKPGTGHICSECGEADLCNNCISENANKFVCKECLKKKGRACDLCGKEYAYRCGVCGIKRCAKDYYNFNIGIKEYSRVLDLKTERLYSLYCPSCKSPICDKCYEEKEGFLRGGLSFYCKKCGSKLKLLAPHSHKTS